MAFAIIRRSFQSCLIAFMFRCDHPKLLCLVCLVRCACSSHCVYLEFLWRRVLVDLSSRWVINLRMPSQPLIATRAPSPSLNSTLPRSALRIFQANQTGTHESKDMFFCISCHETFPDDTSLHTHCRSKPADKVCQAHGISVCEIWCWCGEHCLVSS